MAGIFDQVQGVRLPSTYQTPGSISTNMFDQGQGARLFRPASQAPSFQHNGHAEWWRTIQSVCDAHEHNVQETNLVVEDIAEWARVMEGMFDGSFATSPHMRDQQAPWNPSFEAMLDANSHLEQNISRLRSIFLVLFTLWKISKQRQHALLGHNRKLLKKLASSMLLQQMAMLQDRISQSLAIDPSLGLPRDALLDDVKAIHNLSSNLALIMADADNSLSPSSCSNSTYVPSQDFLCAAPESNIPTILSMNPEAPQPAFAPSGALPVCEGGSLTQIPIPRFAMSQEGHRVDPDLVYMSL